MLEVKHPEVHTRSTLSESRAKLDNQAGDATNPLLGSMQVKSATCGLDFVASRPEKYTCSIGSGT